MGILSTEISDTKVGTECNGAKSTEMYEIAPELKRNILDLILLYLRIVFWNEAQNDLISEALL